MFPAMRRQTGVVDRTADADDNQARSVELSIQEQA
jgi:hypothetical protein